MNEEQKFRELFPEYCRGERCLSPYFDLFQAGIRTQEEENERLKENGIVWHDLRKNPEDLPNDKGFKITDKGNIGFYDSCWEKWYYWNSNEMIFPPIAWCEIPTF